MLLKEECLILYDAKFSYQQTNSQSMIYHVSIRYPEARLLISGRLGKVTKALHFDCIQLKRVYIVLNTTQLATVQLSDDRYRRQ